VPDFTNYLRLCAFFIQNDECATVQESVSVFSAREALCRRFSGRESIAKS
jgi:hypothetical protein